MTENKYGVFTEEERREVEPIETQGFVQDRVKLAGSIRKLFWIAIILTFVTILAEIPFLEKIAGRADTICMIFMLVILFSMGKVIDQYKKAAIFQIVSLVAVVVGAVITVIAELSVGGGVLFLLLTMLVDVVIELLATYFEYKGHSVILGGIDDAFAKKWKALWILEILMIVVSVVGAFLMDIAPMAEIIVTVILCGFATVLNIMKALYLKKMADRFDELAVKCEIAIKEAAEAELE